MTDLPVRVQTIPTIDDLAARLDLSGMGQQRKRRILRAAALEEYARHLPRLMRMGGEEQRAMSELGKVAGVYAPRETVSTTMNLSAEVAADESDAYALIEQLSADAILAARDRFVATHGEEPVEQIVVLAIEEGRAEALAPLGLDLAATPPHAIIEAARRYVANRVGLPSDTTLADLDVELRALACEGDPRTEDLERIVREAILIEWEAQPKPPTLDPVRDLLASSATPPAPDPAEPIADADGGAANEQSPTSG